MTDRSETDTIESTLSIFARSSSRYSISRSALTPLQWENLNSRSLQLCPDSGAAHLCIPRNIVNRKIPFFFLTIDYPDQTRTVVNDRIRRNTAINGEENGRLQFSFTESVYDYRFAPYFPVYHRISPCMVTEKYDRNTRSCNTPKYGHIRS